jgi:hypothetical protein
MKSKKYRIAVEKYAWEHLSQEYKDWLDGKNDAYWDKKEPANTQTTPVPQVAPIETPVVEAQPESQDSQKSDAQSAGTVLKV